MKVFYYCIFFYIKLLILFILYLKITVSTPQTRQGQRCYDWQDKSFHKYYIYIYNILFLECQVATVPSIHHTAPTETNTPLEVILDEVLRYLELTFSSSANINTSPDRRQLTLSKQTLRSCLFDIREHTVDFSDSGCVLLMWGLTLVNTEIQRRRTGKCCDRVFIWTNSEAYTYCTAY